MSFLGYVYCAVIGHSSAHMVSLSMLELSVEQPLAVRAIAKALDDHHQGCSCQGRVSTEAVWKADLPWIKELEYMLENFIPRSDQLVDPTSTLQMLYPNNDPPMKSTHLIFGMVPPLQPGHHAVPFSGVRRLDGNICRVTGHRFHICLPTTSQYGDLSSVEGTIFVDKSDFVFARYSLQSNTDPRIPIIRARAGYGKTTFLSMVASYFDQSTETAQFPSARKGRISGTQYPSLLVLSLDFAKLAQKLPPGRLASHECVRIACKEFLAAELDEFYEKHTSILEDARPLRTARYRYEYKGFSALIRRLGYKIFLAVDNYTAPFDVVTGNAYHAAEREIWFDILGPMMGDVGGFVWRGLMTGLDSGNLMPYERYPEFRASTEDLTGSVDVAGLIGFSYDDVVNIGRATGIDLAANMNLGAAHNVPSGNFKKSVFSARAVIQLLSRLVAGEPLEKVLEESPVDSFMPTSRSQESNLSEKSASSGPLSSPPAVEMALSDTKRLAEDVVGSSEGLF